MLEKMALNTSDNTLNDRQHFFYLGVLLISGLVIAMQLIQTRLLSVITWYHLAFLMISVAMFGLIVSALKVYRGDEDWQRNLYPFLCHQACVKCGFSIIAILILQLRLPIIFQSSLYSYFFLPFIGILSSIPYYYAGVVLALSLTRSPYPKGIVYGIDLLGASLGCLFTMFLLNTIDTPSSMLVLASIASLASIFYLKSSGLSKTFSQSSFILMLVPLILILINQLSSQKLLQPVTIKQRISYDSEFEFNRWNAISYVTVSPEKKNMPPFMWGPSPKLPHDLRASYKLLRIDGNAATPITQLDPTQLSSLSYLEYDVTNLVYVLPHLDDALIIGVGGGRDVLAAKYFGINQVTALDLNPIPINLHTQNKVYADYSNINKLQGVKILNYEARGWLRQNKTFFNLIQMSLVDTWAATTAGAYSLSENGLYTTQSWSLFLQNLKKNGFFTASRWYAQNSNEETARLLSLAISALFNEGTKDIRQHIFLAASNKIATIIIAKSPFTPSQLHNLNKQIADKGYQTLVSPTMSNLNNIFNEMIQVENQSDLIEKTKKLSNYDITPPSDMRPFFFNQLSFNPVHVKKILSDNKIGVFYGQAKAALNLFIIMLLSVVMVLVIIGLSITGKNKPISLYLLSWGGSYFALIGLGFMLIEIALLQGFGLYLGHPNYGLCVVLFSLILSTGIGSFLSARWPINTFYAQLAWCIVTASYVVFMAFNLKLIFYYFAELSIILRALISVSVIFPCGLLFGYGLPTGLALAEKQNTRSTSLFWAVNGAAGVFASVLGIALNISLGIDKTLIIGAGCYALLVAPFAAANLTRCEPKPCYSSTTRAVFSGDSK